jgi:quinolinate synthase
MEDFGRLIVVRQNDGVASDLEAGCSLADSITPPDVRLLRERYPGVPIVAYVNTSAAVKAEADICCTSGNARAVVESVGTDRVIAASGHRARRRRMAMRRHRGWS